MFDTSAPAPEAERLVYGFFGELHGAGIPAVVIAGNHDHPKRLDAVAPLLTSLGIHARGVARGPADGALIEVASRDGRERAVVAALPWLNERDMVDFAQLQDEMGAPLVQYAERVRAAMRGLAAGFDPTRSACSWRTCWWTTPWSDRVAASASCTWRWASTACSREALPTAAQYVALGHVHKNQEVRCGTKAAYSGSLLQLDFGEREQEKYVNLVEMHAKQPAQVTQLPITAGAQADRHRLAGEGRER